MTILETFEALFRAATEDHDVRAFTELWVDDPTITMWGSDLDERATGLEEIQALGEAISASHNILEFRWDELDVHERGGNFAWVNADGRLDVDGEAHPYRLTAVLVRTDAGWRWHTFNGSIPH